jgi:hypothetical protein
LTCATIVSVDIHRNAKDSPNLKNLGMNLGSPSRFPPLPTLEGVLCGKCLVMMTVFTLQHKHLHRLLNQCALKLSAYGLKSKM